MRSSRRPSKPPKVTDDQLKSLLSRLGCPMPLHAFRMLLVGAIASPRLHVSPMAVLAQAWGGELPEFESRESAQESIAALINGLWNRLAEQQGSRNVFRLPRAEVAPGRAALLALARQRAEELMAFSDGLFGDAPSLDLPAKAARALDTLRELHGFFAGAADLLADETRAADTAELAGLLRNLSKLTIAADEQINRVMQSCRLARARQLETFAGGPEAFAPEADLQDQGGARPYDDGPEIIHSPLCQTVSRHGVTVQVEIYRGEDSDWILEIVDYGNNSHVWDAQFATDQEALDEALRALDEDPRQFMDEASDRGLH